MDNQLALEFVFSSPSLEDESSDGMHNRVVYYDSAADVFIQNEDPQKFKKVARQDQVISVSENTIRVASISFAKKNDKWCWSEASYVRDRSDKW